MSDDASKPRTWWVDKTLFEAKGYVQQRAWASDFERADTVQVVETSAYQAVCDENARLKTECGEARAGVAQYCALVDEHRDELGRANERIEKLRVALECYAMTNDSFPEYGDVARQVLAADGEGV